jgi:hypothetical protein
MLFLQGKYGISLYNKNNNTWVLGMYMYEFISRVDKDISQVSIKQTCKISNILVNTQNNFYIFPHIHVLFCI